jgi:hypothetical protein
MSDTTDAVLLVTGLLLAPVFVLPVFCSRRWHFATWARVICVVASLAVVGWGVAGLALLPPQTASPRYYKLIEIKGLLAGIWIGIVLSMFLARPYHRVSPEELAARKV